MNFFKRTFFLFLFLFLLQSFFFKNLSFFFSLILSFSLAVICGYFVQKSVLASFEELKEALKRIKNYDYNARLDDVKGKDFIEIAREFNTLTEELLNYKEKSEKREKELISLINSLPEGLILFNDDLKVVIANETLTKMFPYFNIEAPLASLAIPSLSSMVNKAKEEEKISKEILEESGKRNKRSFEVTFIPLYKGNCAISLIDVSTQKNLEKIKYDLVANVSHELRTPISAIYSMIDVLETENDEERKKEYFSRTKSQVERINALLNDLLSLSRLEGGDYEIKYEEIDINKLINELIFNMETLIKKMNLEVIKEIPESVFIKSDYVLLESIIKNIFENAVKYNKINGKIFLKVEIKEEKLVIEIEDTGEGISEEYRERIFERFFRIDDHRSKKSGGTGLGLSIVKHSLKLLNGESNIESELGKGTKFTVTIPRNMNVDKLQ